MTIDNGRIRHFALPHALENITRSARFDSRGVTLDGLTARLGGGAVQFGGRIDKRGLPPGRIDVHDDRPGMRLRLPEGMRSLVDATLIAAGHAAGGDAVRRRLRARRRLHAHRSIPGGLLDIVGGSGDTADGGGGLAQPRAAALRRADHGAARRCASGTTRVRLVAQRRPAAARHLRPAAALRRAEVERGDIHVRGQALRASRAARSTSTTRRNRAVLRPRDARRRCACRARPTACRSRDRHVHRGVGLDFSSDPPLPEPEILALLFSDVAPGQDVEFRQYSTDVTPQQQLLRERAARALTESGHLRSRPGRSQQTFGVDTFQLTPSLIDPNTQSSRLDPARA